MNLRERALQIIGHTYDAALEPRLWNDVLSGIVAFVGGAKGVLSVRTTSGEQPGFNFVCGVPDAVLRLQEDLLHRVSAPIRHAASDAGAVILLDADAPRAGSTHCAVLQHLRIGSAMTGIACDPEHPDTTVICSIFRNPGDPRFAEEHSDRMKVIAGHLARAMSVTLRLRVMEIKTAATLAALDRASSGVLLIDSRGRVAFANRAAKRIIEQGEGLALKAFRSTTRPRLMADDPRVTGIIDDAIGECLKAGGAARDRFNTAVSVPRGARRRPYMLQMSPLPASSDLRVAADDVSVIVFVFDPERPVELDCTLLELLHGLTSTEIKIADLLAQGMPIKRCAARLRISENTARVHLKHIFDKTGVARQADLMRLLLALARNELA